MSLLTRLPLGWTAAAAVAAVAPLLATERQVFVLMSVLVLAVFATSFNVLLGYTGLVSFAHAAYYGIGTYTVALLALHAGMSPLLGLVLAPVVAGALAWVTGLIALRATRLYFALLTLALGQLLYLVAFQWRSITRGDFAVLLWRYAGSPETDGGVPFVDVTREYQRVAVAWMAERGITTGTTPQTFDPDGTVDRAQAATFLHRYVDPGSFARIESVDTCTRGLRIALQTGGLTKAEAQARTFFPLGERIDPAPWRGARPCLPDLLPAVGPVPGQTGLFVNFGHQHLGFTMGPTTGLLLAQMMTGEDTFTDPSPYRIDRF